MQPILTLITYDSGKGGIIEPPIDGELMIQASPPRDFFDVPLKYARGNIPVSTFRLTREGAQELVSALQTALALPSGRPDPDPNEAGGTVLSEAGTVKPR